MQIEGMTNPREVNTKIKFGVGGISLISKSLF